MKNFKEALQDSQQSVDYVKDYLQEKGYQILHEIDDSRYDILCEKDGNQISVEVKNDLQYDLTGNVALEYLSRKKPSAICKSKADIWCYVLGDEIYEAYLPNLRYKLMNMLYFNKSGNFRIVNGGDDNTSEIILLKLELFKTIFKKVK